MSESSRLYAAIAYAFFIAFLYFSLQYSFMFMLTAPSDPLQYVEPALNPGNGFPYFDRILLWLWIRFISIFHIPVYEIGGIATLLLTSGSLFIGSLMLLKDKLYLGVCVFIVMFFSSPVISGIASYTYPMQMLSFVLILATFSIICINKVEHKFFIFGFFFSLAVLSKVQGVFFAFVFIVLYLKYVDKPDFRSFLFYSILSLAGFLFGLMIVLSIITLLDGFSSVIKLYQLYFESNVSSEQFAGRSAGGIPPVYLMLFQPVFLFSFVSVAYCVIKPVDFGLKLLGFVAAFQVFGLLLIYLITQRGGPLIFNYFMDFQLIGLFLTSYLIGARFHNFFRFSCILPLLVLSIFWVLYLLAYFFNLEPFPYVPDDKYLWVGGFVLFVFLLYRRRFLIDKNILFLTVFVSSMACFFSEFYYAVKHSRFAQSFAEPYHLISSRIAELECLEGEYVYASSKVNRYKVSDGTRRLKKIYTAFYSHGSSCNVIFESGIIDTQNPPTYIVTDRAELLPQKIISSKQINLASNIPDGGVFSDIANTVDLNFKIAGIRGAGKFLASSAESPKLVYVPVKTDGNVVLQIDVSNSNDMVNERFVALSSRHTLNNSNYKLFVQYKIKGSFRRFVSSLDKGEHEIITYIPKQAKEVSYGFRYDSGSALDSIAFPDILLSVISIKDYTPGHVAIIRY